MPFLFSGYVRCCFPFHSIYTCRDFCTHIFFFLLKSFDEDDDDDDDDDEETAPQGDTGILSDHHQPPVVEDDEDEGEEEFARVVTTTVNLGKEEAGMDPCEQVFIIFAVFQSCCPFFNGTVLRDFNSPNFVPVRFLSIKISNEVETPMIRYLCFNNR